MPQVVIDSLIIIAKAYLLLIVWQIIFWPIVAKVFRELPDRGWAMTRMVGILLVSLTVWTLGNLGIRINTDIGIKLTLTFFLLISVVILSYKRTRLSLTKEEIRQIVMVEYIFLAVFFLIAFVRGYMPQLDSLEKFMDYGFIRSYLRSESLPVTDMWQAGESINYYSFGHFWASILIRSITNSYSVGYNLVIGIIGGMAASLTVTLVTLLSKQREKGNLVGGLMAAIAMVFGGNGYTLWYLIKNKTFEGFWYADATRFIHNTIHEFPAYSLIVSDLHGHLLDLPTVLIFITVLSLVMPKRRKLVLSTMGVLTGVMMMTNTWDVLIFGLLTTIYYCHLLWNKKINFADAVVDGLIVATSMFMVMGLWWIKFVPISSGVKMVTMGSPWWQLLVLWWILGIVGILGWLKTTKDEKISRSLVICFLLLIAIPEVIYFKDIYPDHPRANTMFKFTYQAYTLSVVVFGVITTKILNSINEKKHNYFWSLICFGLFGAMVSFSCLAYPSFYGNFKNYQGLNGTEWLRKESAVKYRIYEYLDNNKAKGNIVEAVGDSYTHKNVFSAYTGIPTIQGWRVHEWLWRGSYEPVSKRETEVKEIYEGKEIQITKDILNKYQVHFIIVGPDEDEMYLINHQKLLTLGEKIDFADGYYLILVDL